MASKLKLRAALTIAAITISGCSDSGDSKIADNFAGLRDGMAFDQAVQIMGEPTKNIMAVDLPGATMATYAWESGETAVFASFTDGKLTGKSLVNP